MSFGSAVLLRQVLQFIVQYSLASNSSEDTTHSYGMRPADGRRPYRPLNAAGMRMLPPISVPKPAGEPLRAIRATQMLSQHSLFELGVRGTGRVSDFNNEKE